MALLWISGRTSLLMTLCSVLAILAFLRSQRAIGALLVLAALFAKEDAVAVPVIVVACFYALGRLDRRKIARGAGVDERRRGRLLRAAFSHQRDDAFHRALVYRLLTSPWAIAINGLSYLDRAGTSAAVIALASPAIYRSAPLAPPRGARLFVVAGSGSWPGWRSPSAFRCDPTCTRCFRRSVQRWRARPPSTRFARGLVPTRLPSRDRTFAIVLAALLLLVPVYRIRNARYAEPARVSARVQQALADDLATLPARGTIVFQDAPARFATFGDAFDGMSTSVVQLFTSRPFTADIVMPPEKVSPARRSGALRAGRRQRRSVTTLNFDIW